VAPARRILVLRRGGLGDTLLLLPLLRALRRRHPAAELTVAGVQEFAAVLAAHGGCDRTSSSEDLALWSPASARERLAAWDLVVADDPAAAAAAPPATTVYTVSLRPVGVAPFALQLARQLDLVPRWPEDGWLVAPDPAPRSGPVLLAPGSGSATKCWPRERWLDLGARLAVAPVVVLGPAELERDDPRRWAWPPGTSFVVESEPVRLAARLAAAGVFVGNDSGPTHLAAMLGVPTVALFGPTDPRVWAPVGPHVRVFAADGAMAELPVAPVAAALRAHGSRSRTRSQ
jgi:ADP-heptose:LPS heptosyltransferase